VREYNSGRLPQPNHPDLSLAGCAQIGLSRWVRARYCGEECRAAAFPVHTAFHREFRRSRRWGCAETLCMTMLELAALDELPWPAAADGLPSQTPTLRLLLVLPAEERKPRGGAEEEEEEEEDWLGEVLHLCELLCRFVYPRDGLRCLQVTLVGVGAGAGARAGAGRTGTRTWTWTGGEMTATCCPVPGHGAVTVSVSVRCIPASEEEQVRCATLTCKVR
jgi:hypothetical protein